MCIRDRVNHFLAHYCREESRDIKSMQDAAMDVLANYTWPGNVRELKNLIERVVIMTPELVISRDMLPQVFFEKTLRSLKGASSGSSLNANTFREAKEEFEKEFLLHKLEEHGWNISRTAEAIGIERSNLHRKIKTYGIELKK